MVRNPETFTDMNTAPKETAELVHFLCSTAKAAGAALTDDGRISLPEAIGMMSLLGDGLKGFAGIEKIPGEMSDLTPEQSRELTDIVAGYFHNLMPHQHVVISEAALACVPSLVRLLQTIRNSAALAAEYPGARALPA